MENIDIPLFSNLAALVAVPLTTAMVMAKAYIFLVAAYVSPLVSGGTFIVITCLYSLLTPSLARRTAMEGSHHPLVCGLVGLGALGTIFLCLALLVLTIVGWPVVLVGILFLLCWFVLSACTISLIIASWLSRIIGRELPYSRLGLLAWSLVSLAVLGLVAMIPKLGGFLLTVMFAVSLGAFVMGSRSLTR